MTATKLATVLSLSATLLFSTACGKKNLAVKRAVPATATGTAANQPPPAPSTNSPTTYEYLQGTWTENCESATNEQWSVKINGDVLTYSGVTCGTDTAVVGGFSKKFKLDAKPTQSDFNAHITYLNSDGTSYFDEDMTGTTEPLALYFSGDDTTYFRAGY